MAYQTNLGSDHKEGTGTEGEPGYVSHEEYCYQSTPFRLFYAVGLEDDLILRGANGDQVGVDTSSISPEYIQAHTDAETGNIWFISNYYSNTTYGGYTTDDISRTRGDPTVTFSPGIDNRYYVFQKPLPLYAHAYRITEDNSPEGFSGHAVDNDDGKVWGEGGSSSTGNSSTVWETYKGEQQSASSWVGGQFMGVYKNAEAFQSAYVYFGDAKPKTQDRDSQPVEDGDANQPPEGFVPDFDDEDGELPF